MQIQVDEKCVLDIPESGEYKLSDSYLEDAYIVHNQGIDNKEVLANLKEFIDYYLDQGVKQTYKELSPKIVQKLQEEPCREMFYEYIYVRWVAPLLITIREHNDVASKQTISSSTKALEEFYITKEHERVRGISNLI